jgi:hypothetical protein
MKLLNFTKENTLLLDKVFSQNLRVDFSVSSAIDSGMCKVYVDNLLTPTVFMLSNGIFRVFSGDAGSSAADNFIKAIPLNSIILPSSDGWFSRISETKGLTTEKITRFSMNPNKLDLKKLKLTPVPKGYDVKRIGLADAERLSQSVDFNYHLQNFINHQDFIERGVGYVAKYRNTIIGAATSALICDKGIEINIMVLPKHRKKGIALSIAAMLISEILMLKLIPNWDAGNQASSLLAEKLGYVRDTSYEAIKVSCSV